MKKSCNIFLAIIMSVMALFAGFVSLAGENKTQVSALPPKYSPSSNSIYYFYDYYPTLGYSELSSLYPNYDIYYDYQDVREEQFLDKLNSNYFEGFEPGTLVIIDLKNLTLEDKIILNKLFTSLQSQECKVIFISIYPKSYFNSCEGVDGVTFLQDGGEDLKSMVHYFASSFVNVPTLASDTYYFVDNNMVGIDEKYDRGIFGLYHDNIIIRTLIDELSGNESLPLDDDKLAIQAYTLSIVRNIKIMVKINDYEFMNILTGERYTIEELRFDYVIHHEEEIEYGYYNVCAMGFWYLDSVLYTLLESLQSTMSNVPVYIIERDPIESGGIKIITSINLPNSKAQELLFAIEGML